MIFYQFEKSKSQKPELKKINVINRHFFFHLNMADKMLLERSSYGSPDLKFISKKHTDFVFLL